MKNYDYDLSVLRRDVDQLKAGFVNLDLALAKEIDKLREEVDKLKYNEEDLESILTEHGIF